LKLDRLSSLYLTFISLEELRTDPVIAAKGEVRNSPLFWLPLLALLVSA